MQQTLVLCDQSGGRPPAQALVVAWQESVPLTPRALIAERVRIEWERREAQFEAAPGDASHSETNASESRIRGASPLVDMDRLWRLSPHRAPQLAPSPAGPKPFTLDRVTELALEGFVRNAFFLVVDGRQLTELDETVPFTTTSEVTFVRLLPLVGG
jgi:hypothetical protein